MKSFCRWFMFALFGCMACVALIGCQPAPVVKSTAMPRTFTPNQAKPAPAIPVPLEQLARPRVQVTLPDMRTVLAEPMAPIDVKAASCRVGVSFKESCTPQGCTYATNWGTGTYIAADRVLTCSHLFDEGMDKLEVLFNGKPYPARLLKREAGPDMALLEVKGVNVVPTGYVDILREGEPITICGFNGDGKLRTVTGRFKRWTPPKDGRETFYMDIKNRSGDSGGGAFNPAGQLVGVQWGCPKAADPDGVAVSSGTPLIRFLWGDK